MNQLVVRPVEGSLTEESRRTGRSLDKLFMGVEILLVVDQSGSMSTRDGLESRSRYDQADEELRKLQCKYPGKCGVVAFSSRVQFCPSGVPVRFGGGTNMAKALEFIKPMDGLGKTIFLISDGLPDSEFATIEMARMFKTSINTVFIGNSGTGKAFLERLARIVGGKSGAGATPGLLADAVEQILELTEGVISL